MKLALLDYGAGNLHSLSKALERSGASVEITADWDEALGTDGLVLPGVGSFGADDASLVPQMGWNDIEERADPLLQGADGLVAYCASSFVCEPDDPQAIIARTTSACLSPRV